MNPDHFEATFRLRLDRATAWRRLTDHAIASDDDRLWLPGFDGAATVVERDEPNRLQATKDDEPCAGTDIVVTLVAADNDTVITVVQSGFGDWMSAMYDVMAVGWRHIVADLHTYLATGVHAGRHMRLWGDLGADVSPRAGGLVVNAVRNDTWAARLGLVEADVVVALAGAPVSTLDDLTTVMRVIANTEPATATAEWVRDGALVSASASVS